MTHSISTSADTSTLTLKKTNKGGEQQHAFGPSSMFMSCIQSSEQPARPGKERFTNDTQLKGGTCILDMCPDLHCSCRIRATHTKQTEWSSVVESRQCPKGDCDCLCSVEDPSWKRAEKLPNSYGNHQASAYCCLLQSASEKGDYCQPAEQYDGA